MYLGVNNLNGAYVDRVSDLILVFGNFYSINLSRFIEMR